MVLSPGKVQLDFQQAPPGRAECTGLTNRSYRGLPIKAKLWYTAACDKFASTKFGRIGRGSLRGFDISRAYRRWKRLGTGSSRSTERVMLQCLNQTAPLVSAQRRLRSGGQPPCAHHRWHQPPTPPPGLDPQTIKQERWCTTGAETGAGTRRNNARRRGANGQALLPGGRKPPQRHRSALARWCKAGRFGLRDNPPRVPESERAQTGRERPLRQAITTTTTYQLHG